MATAGHREPAQANDARRARCRHEREAQVINRHAVCTGRDGDRPLGGGRVDGVASGVPSRVEGGDVPFIAALREKAEGLQRALRDLVGETVGGLVTSGADLRHAFLIDGKHACERYLLIVGYPMGVVSDLPPVCTIRSDQFPEHDLSEYSAHQSLMPDVLPGKACLRSLGIPVLSNTLVDAFDRLGWDLSRYTFFVLDRRYPLTMSMIRASVMIGQDSAGIETS